ncbi:helix-turn-helix domain-containing protein [Baekduia alba]|uniref:helix-turn-helix domain-containing protein n=1 Tax=Baekduia alba TaxID=2997333 RepID=UPI002341E356|nr:helix-turn-helix domain-containing protein [Baekduia alba]
MVEIPLPCAIAHVLPDLSNRDPTLARVAAAVRAERKRQGMDQPTLALVANVAVRSVSRIENAHATVRVDVLLRVLAALGLDLDVQRRGQR